MKSTTDFENVISILPEELKDEIKISISGKKVIGVPKAKWRKIFLELAIRALIQVHQRYSVWELGQKELFIENFVRLNNGDGILFAPEETVRDAISQQIIELGLFKSHKIENAKSSYVIDREYKIGAIFKNIVKHDSESYLYARGENTKVNLYVDLIFKRIQTKDPNGDKTIPCLIEAKRHKLFKINYETQEIIEEGFQKDAIDKDILKLRLIHRFVYKRKFTFMGKKFKSFFPYLLYLGKRQ